MCLRLRCVFHFSTALLSRAFSNLSRRRRRQKNLLPHLLTYLPTYLYIDLSHTFSLLPTIATFYIPFPYTYRSISLHLCWRHPNGYAHMERMRINVRNFAAPLPTEKKANDYLMANNWLPTYSCEIPFTYLCLHLFLIERGHRIVMKGCGRNFADIVICSKKNATDGKFPLKPVRKTSIQTYLVRTYAHWLLLTWTEEYCRWARHAVNDWVICSRKQSLHS